MYIVYMLVYIMYIESILPAVYSYTYTGCLFNIFAIFGTEYKCAYIYTDERTLCTDGYIPFD